METQREELKKGQKAIKAISVSSPTAKAATSGVVENIQKAAQQEVNQVEVKRTEAKNELADL